MLNKKNNSYRKNIACCMVMLLTLEIALTNTGCTNAEEDSSVPSDDVISTIEQEPLQGLLGSTISSNVSSIDKEEIVYVIADATGTASQVIVSDHLYNTKGLDTLTDVSNLENIINVKGNQEYTQSGNDIEWNAGGSDIYYQGYTNSELPVTQKITYYLDGEEIAPSDLSGKSGHITIHFDYENHATTQAIINGVQTTVYVPFAAISGIVLDDTFKNIEITNGKMVSDGDRSVVIGYALPGLKESLNVTDIDFDQDVDFPEYFEISADVENCSIDATMTMIVDASEVVNLTGGIDLTNVDDVLNELTDATGQLQDGTDALATGVDTIQSNLLDYRAGIVTLQNGIITYTDGSVSLNQGIQTLQSGVDTVSANMPLLLSGIDDLKEGADSAVTGANNLADGAKKVSDGVNSLVSTINGMGTSIENSKNGVNQNFLNQTGMSYQAAESAITGLSNARAGLMTGIGWEYQALEFLAGGGNSSDDTYVNAMGTAQAYYSNVVSSLAASGINVTVTNVTEALSVISILDGKIEDLKNGRGQVEGAISALNGVQSSLCNTNTTNQLSTLQDGAKKVSDGATTLATGLTNLANGIGTLYQKCNELSSGIAQLSVGASALLTGSNAMVNNQDAILTGMQTILDATDQLIDGIDTLDNGAHDLEDGVIQLNEDGIDQMVDAYQGDVKSFAERMEAVIDAGEDYQTFTGIGSDQTGTVKIIIRTEGI